jgi:aubergine-like protein
MEAIKGYAPQYDPKILFMFINKRITTRFFEKCNGGVINPGPGTCVDSTIVSKDSDKIFDFYMVANENPTSATAIPVHYQVVVNTTNLSKQEIQEMTYH